MWLISTKMLVFITKVHVYYKKYIFNIRKLTSKAVNPAQITLVALVNTCIGVGNASRVRQLSLRLCIFAYTRVY